MVAMEQCPDPDPRSELDVDTDTLLFDEEKGAGYDRQRKLSIMLLGWSE